MSALRSSLIVVAAMAGLAHGEVVLAQGWTLTDTRRVTKADTSYTPAEWKVADGGVAALKQWVDRDGRRLAINTTCSWKGVPGGFKPGEVIPVSVKIDQRQNTQTGYDSWVKLYAGEEGGNEADGPDAAAGWREGAASRTASGQITVPKGSARAFIIRAHCKVAGDAHDTLYVYTWRDGLAATGGGVGAAAPPGPGTPAAAHDGWSGAWSTNFGAMTLSQAGSQVTGRYDYRGGRIEGRLDGRVLRGTWIQDNARGHFVFRLAADGRSFQGRWGRGSADSDGGDWQGSR